MKILLGYSYYEYPQDVKLKVDSLCSRLRSKGIDIYSFPLTLNPPGSRLLWKDLDQKWKNKESDLMSLYENLATELRNGYDVFVNWNGINIHPDFLGQLDTFNVYGCFDDPESSDTLSKPVAWAFDLSLVGNIAEVDTYKRWGVKEVRFWPMGFFDNEFDPSLTKEKILNGERDVDLTLLCERLSDWRKSRLDRFESAFPDGEYYGQGWRKGFLAESLKIPLYQRTKIGPNFHNSTGPINYRTYTLPANGVMQLCDNKSNLGKIFELDKEVVGFDTIDECIDKCHYYLSHDDERRHIAAEGFERAKRDYNEYEVFSLVEKYVTEVKNKERDKPMIGKIFSNIFKK